MCRGTGHDVQRDRDLVPLWPPRAFRTESGIAVPRKSARSGTALSDGRSPGAFLAHRPRGRHRSSPPQGLFAAVAGVLLGCARLLAEANRRRRRSCRLAGGVIISAGRSLGVGLCEQVGNLGEINLADLPGELLLFAPRSSRPRIAASVLASPNATVARGFLYLSRTCYREP